MCVLEAQFVGMAASRRGIISHTKQNANRLAQARDSTSASQERFPANTDGHDRSRNAPHEFSKTAHLFVFGHQIRKDRNISGFVMNQDPGESSARAPYDEFADVSYLERGLWGW